ncbi:hypothetical protein [Brucella anthropi]|uniref:hypothetical protein n=1 Tax=Brucella anthropi TaxID=529 RepID=UPI0011862962|nr:hypothetical protein [Brucella anthropi]
MEEVEACWFLVKPILREQQKTRHIADCLSRISVIKPNWPDQTMILRFYLHRESFTEKKRKGSYCWPEEST